MYHISELFFQECLKSVQRYSAVDAPNLMPISYRVVNSVPAPRILDAIKASEHVLRYICEPTDEMMRLHKLLWKL